MKSGSRLAFNGFLLGFAIIVGACFGTKADEAASSVGAVIGWTLGTAYIIFALSYWKKRQRAIVREGSAWLTVILLSYFAVFSLVQYEIATNRALPPGFAPAFFLLCAAGYGWYGIRMLRKSDFGTSLSNRLRKAVGVLLLICGIGFLSGFVARIKLH